MMQLSTLQRLRQLTEQCAALLTLPDQLIYRLQTSLLSEQQAFLALSQRASLKPGFVGIYLRRAIYRRYLLDMGEDVAIGMGTILTKPTIVLGNAVYIGSYCLIGDARIGDNTLIADQVSIVTGNHGLAPDQLMKDQPESYRRITIGQDCWLGSRAVIMADVADHAVVGAGSIVTKPVAPYAIVAGNPARPIGDRRERGDRSNSLLSNRLAQPVPVCQPTIESAVLPVALSGGKAVAT